MLNLAYKDYKFRRFYKKSGFSLHVKTVVDFYNVTFSEIEPELNYKYDTNILKDLMIYGFINQLVLQSSFPRILTKKFLRKIFLQYIEIQRGNEVFSKLGVDNYKVKIFQSIWRNLNDKSPWIDSLSNKDKVINNFDLDMALREVEFSASNTLDQMLSSSEHIYSPDEDSLKLLFKNQLLKHCMQKERLDFNLLEEDLDLLIRSANSNEIFAGNYVLSMFKDFVYHVCGFDLSHIIDSEDQFHIDLYIEEYGAWQRRKINKSYLSKFR